MSFNKLTKHRSSFALVFLFFALCNLTANAQSVLLSTSPTLTFTNNTGLGTMATDGTGGSVAISDFDLQIFAGSKSGVLNPSATMRWEDASYFASPNYTGLTPGPDPDMTYYGVPALIIKSASQATNFSLKSMELNDWGGAGPLTIASYNNGALVGSVVVTIATDGSGATLTQARVLTPAHFTNIDEVRIFVATAPNFWLAINKIQVGAVAAVNSAPVIGGTIASQEIPDKKTALPFSTVTITDADGSQTQAVRVTLDAAAKGSFTTLSGFTNAGAGVYTFSGTPAAAQAAIRGLVFSPTENRVAPEDTETTTFTISVNDGVAVAVTNNSTKIISTSVNDAPIAYPEVFSVAKGGTIAIKLPNTILSNDIDPEGSPLTASVVSFPTNASGGSLHPDGTLTYINDDISTDDGVFTYRVYDGSLYSNETTVTIHIIDNLAVSAASQTNALCYGASNGTATVGVTGGTAPYTYSWSSGTSTAATASNLASGTYTVTITDKVGATATQNFTITQPSLAIAGKKFYKFVSCNGGSDGGALVVASGGTAPYTYLWSSGETTSSISGKVAGLYNVTITDALNCTAVYAGNSGLMAGFVLTQPTQLTQVLNSKSNVSSIGGSNGSIKVNVGGGAGSYIYDWSPGTPTGEGTNTATGLSAGIWSLTVTDANGCMRTSSYTVLEPTVTVSGAPLTPFVSCLGSASAAQSFTVSAVGLIANLTVVPPTGFEIGLSSSGPFGSSASLSPTAGVVSSKLIYIRLSTTATGSPSGNLVVSSLNANSENVALSGAMTTLVGATVVTNVCAGSSNGTIGLTASGGTAPYSYNWGSGVTTKDRTGLAVGSYTVIITDAGGCSATITAIIVSKPSPTAIATPSAATITTGSTTNIALTSDLTGTSYSWTSNTLTGTVNGATAGSGTSIAQTLTGAGTLAYTITPTLAGCVGTPITVVITVATPLVAARATLTNISCFGASDGSATVIVSGGVPNYTYSWSPSGSTDARANNLFAGVHTVTVTDGNGTIATQTFTINQPLLPLTAISMQTSVSCFGGSNGTATVTASGGTPGYTYSWSPIGGTGATATGLSAGTYTITVTDRYGCTTTETVTVTEPSDPLSAKINTTIVSCFGGTNGTASAIPTGGTAGYTYSWSPRGGTGAIASGLSAGTYTVTITDLNGCMATATATITEPLMALTAATAYTNVSCFKGSNGAASVSARGGTSGYTYSWSPRGGTGATATGLSAGNYTVTITDANGCTLSKSFTIEQPTNPVEITALSQSNVSVFGGNNGAASINAATGGTPDYTYNWSPGNPAGDGTTNVTGLLAGTYTVTATDANGCTGTTTFTITQPPAPPIIGGALAAQAVNDNATISPFSTVTIVNSERPALGQTTSVTLDLAAKGSFTTLSGFTNAGNGVYTFSGIASLTQSALRGLVFKPSPNRVSTGSTETTTFTISVNDGIAVPAINALTTVISTAMNSAPIAVSDSYSVARGATLRVNSPGLLMNDSDHEGNTLTAQLVSSPGHASLTLNADGSFVYINNGDDSGTDSFTYLVNDGNLNSTTATVTINLTTAVTVSAISRTSARISNASALSYTVLFSEPVIDVDVSDFVLTTSGVQANIGTPVGSGTSWTVPLTSVIGDGTLRLDFVNRRGVTPNVLTAFTSGEIYTVDHTAPAVPNGLEVTSITTENTLSWNANTENDLTSYKIYGGTVALPTTLIATVNAGTITYLHTALTMGKTYHYRITAVDAVGNESNYGTPVSILTKAAQTIAFTALAPVTYGDAEFDPQAAASSSLVIAYHSNNLSVAKIVAGKIQIVGAGTALITSSQPGNGSYLPALDKQQLLTVLQKNITLSLNTNPLVTKVYDALATATLVPTNYSLTNVINGDDVSVIGTAIYATKQIGNAKNITANNFILGGTKAGNYNLTTSTAATTGAITAKTLSLTLNSSPLVSKEYDALLGATLLPSNYILTGVESGDAVGVSGSASYDNKSIGAGKTVTANTFILSGGDAGNYLLATTTANTTGAITSKNLTLALNASPLITKQYDALTTATLGAANYTLTGVANTDEVTVYGLSNYDTKQIGAGKTITVNTFVLGGTDAGNYTLSTTSANVLGNVTARSITVAITTNPALTKVYNATAVVNLVPTNYALTGVQGSDAVAVNGVGSYNDKNIGANKAIVVQDFILTGLDAPNYTMANASALATGTITPRILSLALNSIPAITKTYDGNLDATLAATNYMLSGIQTNEDVKVAGTATYNNAQAALGKEVTATGFVLAGADHSNYLLNTLSAVSTGTIVPKVITVDAAAKTKAYKVADPAFTYTSSALLGGDSFTGALSRIAGENVGNYAITQGSLTLNSNYVINYNGLNLTITARPITVISNDHAKLFGDVDPIISYSFAPNVESGEGFNGLLSRQPGEVVGNYKTTQGSLTLSPNYTITFTGANFDIYRKVITVVASGATKIYGNPDPSLSYTFSPTLRASDVFAGTLSRQLGEDVGDYAIQQGTLALNSNYTLIFNAGNLLITPKAAQIIAVATHKVYGDSDPQLSYTVTGIVAGDNFSGNLLRAAGENVGNYAILQGTVSGGPNYTIGNFNPASLTINKRQLTIKADDILKKLSSAIPALTATYTGFISSESNNVLTAQPMLATAALISSPAGSYPITVSGALATNYSIAYQNGTLTIASALTSDISLLTSPLYENAVIGSDVGQFSSLSDDPLAQFTYSLIAGAGSADNALFSIQGSKLRLGSVLDFENKSAFSIRIKSTDQNGSTFEKTFSLSLIDVNEVPTLDAIVNQAICTTPNDQSISLSGITAGTETNQTVSLSVSTTNSALFASITANKGFGTSGTLNYKLALGASGTAVVTVTAKDNGGTSFGGVESLSRTFTIIVNALPTVSITSDKGANLLSGKTAILTATGGTSYIWTNASGIISGQNTAVLTVNPSLTTTYSVTATNASGCSVVASITINVISDDVEKIKASNVMSPNGDGINDTWVVENIGLYPNNFVKIVDNAGRSVYSKANYDNSWDATLRGAPLAEGTYYYVIDFGDGKTFKKGFITILRKK